MKEAVIFQADGRTRKIQIVGPEDRVRSRTARRMIDGRSDFETCEIWAERRPGSWSCGLPVFHEVFDEVPYWAWELSQGP